MDRGSREGVPVQRFASGVDHPLDEIDWAEGGLTEALDPFWREHLDAEQGFRWLYGKTGAQTVGRLDEALRALGTVAFESDLRGPYHVLNSATISKLGHDAELVRELRAADLDSPENADLLARGIGIGLVLDVGAQQKPTPGNAGAVAAVLVCWAKQHPEAVWDGD